MRLRPSLSIMLGVGWLLLPWHRHPFSQPATHAAHMSKPQQSLLPTQQLWVNFI